MFSHKLERSKGAPCARCGHKSTIHKENLIVFGGNVEGHGTSSNTIHSYSTKTKEWCTRGESHKKFNGIFGHVMITYKNIIYIFGGLLAESLELLESEGDMDSNPFFCYMFDLNENVWIIDKGVSEVFSAVRGRFAHSGDLYRNFVYMFGGDCTDLIESFDTFLEYDLDSNILNELKLGGFSNRYLTAPCARSFPSTSVDQSNGNLYLFGGLQYARVSPTRTNETHLNDLWVYIRSRNEWKFIDYGLNGWICPKQRRSACMVDGKDNNMLLFGGFDVKTFFNDLWEFDFVTEKWREIGLHGDMIPPRRYFSMSVLGGDIYLFGGYLTGKLNGEAFDDCLDDFYRIEMKFNGYGVKGHFLGAVRTGSFSDVIVVTK
jgi:hypothetical protein